MKKKILLMLFPLLAMSLTACDKGNPDPDPAPVEKVVDSLSVKTQPTKTTYNAGESFDSSGMVLTVNYVGGTSEDITSGWTVAPAGALNASDNKVTVSYGGKSVDVAITVNGDTPTPPPVHSGMKEAYEAALAAGDTETTDEYNVTGVVVGKRVNGTQINYYVSDGQYGLDVFDNQGAITDFAVGKSVNVVGTVKNYNGDVEFAKISKHEVLGDGQMPAAVTIDTKAKLDAGKHNVLANTAGAISAITQNKADATGKIIGTADLTITLTVSDGTIDVFFKKNSFGARLTDLNALVAGNSVTVEKAVIGAYKANMQILVCEDTVITKGSGPVQPVLSLDKTTASVEVEKTVTVTATVLNTEDPVVWSLEGDAASLSYEGKVATVTGVSEGTATLKAAVAGLEKTCVVTVTPKGTQTDYGTEDSPISISAAAAILAAECVNDEDLTKQAITAIGEVKAIRNTFSYESGPCFEMDLTDGTSDVYLYRCHATEALAANIAVGSTVKFVGYAKNFKGTLEFVDNGSSNQCHVLSATATTEPTLILKETETVKVGADVVLTATVQNTENAVEWSLLGDSGSYASITPNGNSVTVRGIAKGLAKVKASIPADNLEAVCEVTVEEDVHVDVDVDYSFSALEKKDSPAMTNDEAKAAFVNGLTSGTDIVSSVTVNNTYAGAASIRVGSKNGGGSLVIATTEKVTKVVVTAHGYSSTELNKISIGTEEVTVKADADKYVFEVTATQSITINADKRVLIDGIGFVTEAKREIEKIEIVGTLAKDTYFVGDTFDPTGLSLKVTYTEGDPETLTSGFTFSVDTLTEEGVINVYAEYKDERSENSVQITVNKVELVSMEVVVAETYDKTYVVGENWATEGIGVKGHFNNGDEHILNAEDYDLSFDPTAPAMGVTEVEVTATHKTADLTPATKTIDGIVVTAEEQPELDSIVVKTNPTKMTYNEGESFDPAGLVITASYTLDKASEDKTYGVDEGIVCEVADPLTTSSTTVTVKYTEAGKTVQTTLTIKVNSVAEHGTTENDPLNADEAYAIADKLEAGAKTTVEYYIEGSVARINSAYSSQYNNISLDLKTSDDKTFVLFRVGCTAAQAETIAVGTVVKVKAIITKYVKDATTTLETDAGGSFVSINNPLTAIEITGSAKIEVSGKSTYTAKAVPELASLGTVTWSIESGGSYISLPETKTGSSIEVTGVAKGNAVIKATSGAISNTFSIEISETPVEEKTLIFDGQGLGTTALTKDTEIDCGDANLMIPSGSKAQSVDKTKATNRLSDNATIFTPTGTNAIYNTAAVPGAIAKLEIYSNNGASTSGAVDVSFSDSLITDVNPDAKTNIAFGTANKVYEITNVPAGSLYFAIKNSSAKSIQIQIRVTYYA